MSGDTVTFIAGSIVGILAAAIFAVIHERWTTRPPMATRSEVSLMEANLYKRITSLDSKVALLTAAQTAYESGLYAGGEEDVPMEAWEHSKRRARGK